MPIVSRAAIARIQDMRDRARNASTWEASYQWAARAAEAALAQLEQIDAMTQNVKITVETKD